MKEQIEKIAAEISTIDYCQQIKDASTTPNS